MLGRSLGPWRLVWVSALGAAIAAVGCGGGSKGSAGSSAGAGQTAAGGAVLGSTAGSAGRTSTAGGAGGAGSTTPGTPAEACRDYFTTVCARIRECGARTFRPCESPIDACPEILFASGSSWSVAQVVACTAQWKTQACDALAVDQGPACGELSGMRPLGDPCAFDVQCKSGRCNGGVVPNYQAKCGVCAGVAPSHGACSDQQVCPSSQECTAGTCVDRVVALPDPCSGVKCAPNTTCSMGVCAAPPGVGGNCSPATDCAAGLACQIEIVLGPDENEPRQGVCQPLPAIGQGCLPTFGHIGVCVAGGTCDGRPTGNCVPLVQVGKTCGYTQCVDGAYCQVLGYDNLPPYICYLRGPVGAECDYSSPDHGTASCAEGLNCICAQPPCDLGTCQQPSIAAGATGCGRSTAFGRESGDCTTGECLCLNMDCATPVCAQPRNFGESCDGSTQICRQGLTCRAGQCADATDRNLDALACPAKAL